MTVYSLTIAPKAKNDVASIYRHIANDSPTNADRMVSRIREAFVRIQETPHRSVVAGQESWSNGPIRSSVVDPYFTFFQVDEAKKDVRILRVRHGARQPLRRFF